MRKKKKCNITVYLLPGVKARLMAEAERVGMPVTRLAATIIGEKIGKAGRQK